jgi:hypothetical protein
MELALCDNLVMLSLGNALLESGGLDVKRFPGCPVACAKAIACLGFVVKVSLVVRDWRFAHT